MKISIIIPIFNERKNIKELIFQIRKRLIKNSYEIIIVDDSSTDGSKKVLNSLNKKYKNLKVIFRNNEIRDLSKSCRDGFEKSKYKNILVMDGDLQHDPIYIPKMIKIFNKNKVILLELELKNKRVKVLVYLDNFINFNNYNTRDNFKKTDDPMSGFFLFKKAIYEKNKNKLFLKGFKILADLIFLNNNFKIDDIKIKFNYRKNGKSKLNLNITLIIIQFIIVRFFTNLFLK